MGKSLALIAIFCLSACFMSSVSGTETSTSMLRGLQLIQMQTGYVVDDILAFLKSFETDIWNQITHLDEAVRVETEYLEQLIRDLEVQRQNKLQECQGHQTETDTIINEYNKQLDFVNWVTKRINENYEKIENYHKQSCQQTLDFVEYLRNSQNALNLIQFLRQSLTDYSFTQLKPLALILKHYSSDSSLYSTSKGLQLMLVQFQAALHQVDPSQYHSGDSLNDRVHSRTGDEIGQAHIDNDEDNIEVDSFQGGKRMGLHAVKEELFKILDALEAKIKQNMNDRINNMITLAETTAEYIIVLEREIEYLQKELVHQQEVLREIEIRVKESQAIVEQCYVEYEQIVSTIKETKEKHDNYIKDKGAYREVLLDQLDQLTAIINLYETKIASTGENFKTRYDDVLDNNVVDYSAHVDERELKVEYDHLQNPEDLDLSIEDDIVLTPADENDESF